MTDEQLASFIDKLGKDDASEQLGSVLSFDDLEIVSATKRAKEYERKPSWIDKFKTFVSSIHYDSNVSRDIRRLAIVPSFCVAALICVMLFSPLSQQYTDIGLARGMTCSEELDSLVQVRDFQSALDYINREINILNEDIPKIAYLDRFRSKQERYEISLVRAEIYELNWVRIQVLSAQGDNAALHDALKKYSHVIGYHQSEAKSLLKQLEGE